MTTPDDLLTAQLRRDGARPLLTYYDHATGERVELSVATTANWVAKTANYLIDELDVSEGDTVSVLLPLHWQAAVLLLASWAVGAQVTVEPGGDVAFTTETAAGAVGSATVVLTLAPMGADFARLVAAQPDTFAAHAASGEDLVAAAPVDLPHAARVLTGLRYDGAAAIGYGLIAPLAVSGSVVMVRNADPQRLAADAGTERVTHALGIDIAGVPRLDGG